MVGYYCINRECDTARRTAMEAQARRLGFDLAFVSAVEGASVDYDDPSLGYNRRLRLQAFDDLTRNEIACACSHRRVLEQFLSGPAAFAVVLEDDANLADNFPLLIEELVRESHGWHMLRLECRTGRRGYDIGRVKSGPELYAPLDPDLGSTGILYSRDGARRVLHALRSFARPIDDHIGLSWRWGLYIVELDPPIVKEDKAFPSVTGKRHSRRRRGFRAWLWTRPLKVVRGVAKRIQALRTKWNVHVQDHPSGLPDSLPSPEQDARAGGSPR